MRTIKNKTAKLKALYVVVLIVMSILTVRSQPLCSYNIHNNLDCTVTVDVDFLETPCASCATSPQTSILIPANSTYVITCSDISTIWGCVNSLCDMTVKMTSPITTSAIFLNHATGLSGLPSGCNAGTSPQMDVSASDTNINK